MTEADWLFCSDPAAMLAGLGPDADARKLLLFCVAAVRKASADAREILVRLEVAERYADGSVGTDEVRRWWGEHRAWPEHPGDWAVEVAKGASRIPGHPTPSPAVKADLLRDIFGDPSRPVAFDPAWRTPRAVKLAEVAYSVREFGLMPALAETLEQTGCTHDAVLTHCRKHGSLHVRGCWVLGLVLSKT